MENNVMEENKNKNIVIGVMACIIVLLLLALVYFVFIKKDSKPVENNKENNQQVIDNTNQVKENNNFKPWMKYILEQNITSIELSKEPCSNETFNTKKVIINVDQLKNIFNKMVDYKLRVAYIGGSGWDCGESLKIKYLKNGKEYEIEYLDDGKILASSNGCKEMYDKDLENALYNSVDVKENEEAKGQPNICTMYDLVTPDRNLLDEYFK